MTKSKID